MNRLQITPIGIFLDGRMIEQSYGLSVIAQFRYLSKQYHIAAFNVVSAGDFFEVFIWI